MLDEPLDEIHDRNGFLDILFIFMSVVVKSDKVTIILVNSWSSDNRSSKVTPNIFYNCFRVAFIRFGINVEAFFMFLIAKSFYFLKEDPILFSILFNRAVRKELRRKV